MINVIHINIATPNDLDNQIHRVIKTLSDPEQFEEAWNEGNLEEDILNISDQLETKIGYSKELETLYDVCRVNQEVNDSIGEYLAFSNIHLRLIESHPDEDIERFLQPFIGDPIKTIDHLMKVTNLFVLFGRLALAVKLCKDVFERVAENDSFWGNPEDKLAKVIFCCELQKMLIHLQAGNALNWNDFDRTIRYYGYDFNESAYLRFEEMLLGKIDSKEISKQFKKEFSPSLWDIQMAFCSYMWNEKKIPFSTSEVLSTLVLEFLASKMKSPNCGVDKFFKFTEANLEEYVVSLVGVLLPCIEDGFALVWGLPMFYKYLNTIGLVDNKFLVVVVEISDSIKNKLISSLPNSRKTHHFIDVLCE